MDVRELHPMLGVEISDLDISALPNSPDAQALRDLWRKHHLLRFRGNPISPLDHIKIMSTLGQVLDERGDGAGYGVSKSFRKDAPTVGSTTHLTELSYHADYLSTPYPLEGISLYAVAIAGAAAPTLFVDAMRGLKASAPDLLRKVENLTVINIANSSGTQLPLEDFDKHWAEIQNGTFEGVLTERPVVFAHPYTGEPTLAIAEMFSIGFVGMSREAARPLIEDVFRAIYDVSNNFTQEWQTDDLVAWDNVALQHARDEVPPGTPPGARTLRRVAISATYPQLLDMVPRIRDVAQGTLEKSALLAN